MKLPSAYVTSRVNLPSVELSPAMGEGRKGQAVRRVVQVLLRQQAARGCF